MKDLVGVASNAFSHNFLSFAMDVFLSWGFLWFLGILGILLIPIEQFPAVLVAFVLLFIGGFRPSLFYRAPADTFRGELDLSRNSLS